MFKPLSIPTLAAALLLVHLPLHAQSDLEVEGAIATQFTKSKGASLLGRNIHWHVNAKVFHVPKKERNGYALYVSQGIGILTEARSNAVEEIIRRGGAACVRGRVIRLTDKEAAPGEPKYAIAVSSLSRRKK